MQASASVKRFGLGRIGSLALALAVGGALILLVIAVSSSGSDGEGALARDVAPAAAVSSAERMAFLEANLYLPEVSASVEGPASLATESVSVQQMRFLEANLYLPGDDTIVERGPLPQHPIGLTP